MKGKNIISIILLLMPVDSLALCLASVTGDFISFC